MLDFWQYFATSCILIRIHFRYLVRFRFSRVCIGDCTPRNSYITLTKLFKLFQNGQMESLYERYSRNVAGVRDHYHAQMEGLRSTYESNVEKLKDYKVMFLQLSS